MMLPRLCKHLSFSPLLFAPSSCLSPSPPSFRTASSHAHDVNYLKSLENKEKLREKQKFYKHFRISHSLPSFREQFDYIGNGEKAEEEVVSVAGRVTSAREAGNKMMFLDILSEQTKVQLMCIKQQFDDPDIFNLLRNAIRRGDIIGAKGNPGRTKLGELSVIPSSLQLLAPCTPRLPDQNSLLDIDKRAKERWLDLIVNDSSLETLLIRSKIIKNLRNFLDSKGFVEVETPILSSLAGGAAAVPFETHSRTLDEKFYLRIAPELALKKLVIGGMEKVYEIGKNFRNEGLDATHNPEFTSCEFYCAYADYKDLMDFTEELLHTLVVESVGAPQIQFTEKIQQNNGENEEEEAVYDTKILDFTPPFNRIDVWKELGVYVGEAGGSLPLPTELDTEEANLQLQNLFTQHLHLPIPSPATTPRLIDKLISHFIEPRCTQPTFLYGHPIVMSPLARESEGEGREGLVDRFELVVGGRELVNAYSELSDPEEQRRRFNMQLQDRDKGDQESHGTDETFLQALEYGLPPTAGWGMGVDRLVMFLTSKEHIRDVLAFPMVKQEKKEEKKEE